MGDCGIGGARKALGVASTPPLGKRCQGEDGLALADAVHLGATDRALAPGGRLAVLHGDLLGTLHLSLRPALQTVCLHPMVPPSLLFPNGRRRGPQERMPVEPLAGGVRAVPQALRIPLVFESDSLGRIIALFRPMSRESTCEFADDFLQCRLEHFFWVPAASPPIAQDGQKFAFVRVRPAGRIDVEGRQFRARRLQDDQPSLAHIAAVLLAQ